MYAVSKNNNRTTRSERCSRVHILNQACSTACTRASATAVKRRKKKRPWGAVARAAAHAYTFASQPLEVAGPIQAACTTRPKDAARGVARVEASQD